MKTFVNHVYDIDIINIYNLLDNKLSKDTSEKGKANKKDFLERLKYSIKVIIHNHYDIYNIDKLNFTRLNKFILSPKNDFDNYIYWLGLFLLSNPDHKTRLILEYHFNRWDDKIKFLNCVEFYILDGVGDNSFIKDERVVQAVSDWVLIKRLDKVDYNSIFSDEHEETEETENIYQEESETVAEDVFNGNELKVTIDELREKRDETEVVVEIEKTSTKYLEEYNPSKDEKNESSDGGNHDDLESEEENSEDSDNSIKDNLEENSESEGREIKDSQENEEKTADFEKEVNEDVVEIIIANNSEIGYNTVDIKKPELGDELNSSTEQILFQLKFSDVIVYEELFKFIKLYTNKVDEISIKNALEFKSLKEKIKIITKPKFFLNIIKGLDNNHYLLGGNDVKKNFVKWVWESFTFIKDYKFEHLYNLYIEQNGKALKDFSEPHIKLFSDIEGRLKDFEKNGSS